MIYTGVFAVFYVLTPNLFFFAHETDSGDFETIKHLVILYLKFVAVYCIFDTIQIIFVSAIKGAGDTRFVVIVTIITALIFVGVGSKGATFFDGDGAKVNWWWASLTGWILLLSVIYWIRFMQGKWRKMSVIEREADEPIISQPAAAETCTT